MAQDFNPDAHMLTVEEALDVVLRHVVPTPIEAVSYTHLTLPTICSV